MPDDGTSIRQAASGDGMTLAALLESLDLAMSMATPSERHIAILYLNEWLARQASNGAADKRALPTSPSPANPQSDGSKRVWPNDNPALAAEVRAELIMHFGLKGGKSNITDALSYLQLRGAPARIDRASLTQILNRMCLESKTTKRTLLERVPRARGEFMLHTDGQDYYQELRGRETQAQS